MSVHFRYLHNTEAKVVYGPRECVSVVKLLSRGTFRIGSRFNKIKKIIIIKCFIQKLKTDHTKTQKYHHGR